MNQKGGLITFSFKLVLFLIALMLVAYGYYGYYYVPSKSVGPFGPPCPLGHEGSTDYFGFTMGTGPCRFSKMSFVIGMVIIGIVLFLTFMPKGKKKS